MSLAEHPSGTHPAVAEAVGLSREARLLGSTAAILGWDQETMMPPGGLEHRARQLAQLERKVPAGVLVPVDRRGVDRRATARRQPSVSGRVWIRDHRGR